MNTEKMTYMVPQTKWLTTEMEYLLSGSTTSDGEQIGNDPTPGTGEDQAAKESFDSEEWNKGTSVWDE